MLAWSVVVAAVAGAIVGSFLNVVICRLPVGESLVKPGSHCARCGEPVACYDNIPILSWLLLSRKCRSCRAAISIQYPLVEAATALLFAVAVAVDGVGSELLLSLPFLALLITVTVIDLRHRIIPNGILLFATPWALVVLAVFFQSQLVGHLIAAAVAGGALLLIALAYPRGMGMGDVKLAAVMGIYLGSSVGVAALIGFACGAAIGALMILKEGRAARKEALPLGPFLAVGGLSALFFGQSIVQWYLHSFF